MSQGFNQGIKMDNETIIFEESHPKNPDNFTFTNDPNALRGLELLSQNFNSMNFSTYNHDQINVNQFHTKIISTFKKSNMIIFAQDLRVQSNEHIIKNEISVTPFGNFDYYLNSHSQRSRGVGIFINARINCHVFSIYKSLDQNIIILDCSLNNFRISLCNLYGPNCNCPDYHKQVKEKLISIGNKFFILGGDMNSIPIYASSHTNPMFSNIDTLNMQSIPNAQNSNFLAQQVEEGFYVDLFRCLNPCKLEFSHVPFGVNKMNRSRIDLFLTNPELSDIFTHCEYLAEKNSVFDHKAILMRAPPPSSQYSKGHRCFPS